MQKERINEILGLVLFAFSVFLVISFITYQPEDIPFFVSEASSPVQNAAGLIGAYISFGIFYVFGVCGYLIPLVFVFWAVCMFLQKVPEKLVPKILGFIGMQISVSMIAALVSTLDDKFYAGGVVGYVISDFLSNYLGFSGTFIYSVFCLLISFLLATEFLLYEVLMFAVEKVTGFVSSCHEFIIDRFMPEEEEETPSKKKAKAKKEEKAEKKEKKSGLKDIEVKIKKYEDQIKNIKKKDKKEEEAAKKVEAKVAPQKEDPKLAKAVEALKDSVKEEEEELLEDEEIEDLEYEYEDEEDVDEDDIDAEDELEEDEEEDDEEEEDDDDLPEFGSSEEDEEEEEDDEEEVATSTSGETATDEKKGFHFVSLGAKDEDSDFNLPPHRFLNDPKLADGMKGEDLKEKSKIIEDRLHDFDIEVKVTEVEQGPVITRYEILPAPGIKLSRIVGLQDDIALSLKVSSIRIAPVPGKSTVGIEVPNSVSNMVYLKELLEDANVNLSKYALPLFLGKNTSGKPLVADLTEMPHLLVAGTTGSGKTVCLNSIIGGLLYKLKPSQMRLVMVDPKMVELAVYNDIPHLAAPVVTDAKKASSVLNWVTMEMENRYKLLASVGVRNIKSFNTRTKTSLETSQNIPDKLPYIVVVIDELADLMLVAADKIESTIARLAQLSRAVGIHLILATQRPSVDVITGVIKANFPARISFKVASKIDSRTVLDIVGADKLLGKGDMLFLEPGHAKPVRSQCAFVSDKEIKDVANYLKDEKDVEYLKELEDITSGKVSPQMLEKDDMYDDAVQTIMEVGQASVSVLQRRLRLGYARAARIIDQMEAEGIVGPYQGSRPRDILVKREEYIK